MAIKTGQTDGIVAVGTTDTQLDSTSAGESHEHYSWTLHNTSSSSSITVELFISADSSSALSEEIFNDSLGPKERKRSSIITLDESTQLLGKASAAGVNFNSTYTLRNGSDK